MSQGADDFSDAGLKPFRVPGNAGDPARVVQPKEHSLDTPNTEKAKATPDEAPPDPDEGEEEKKAQEHGKKAVENYAAKIQEHSEQLYERLAYRAKSEEGFLDTLLSGDKLEKKMAEKILERNPDHFKSKSVEDYVVNREKKKAGDDPVAQGLAEIKARQVILEQKQQKDEWESFKKDNQVTGDFAKKADEVHTSYPDMPYGLAVAAAKGLMNPGEISRKETTTPGSGSVGAPPAQGEVPTPRTAAGKYLLRKIDVKKVQKFAKEYLKDS